MLGYADYLDSHFLIISVQAPNKMSADAYNWYSIDFKNNAQVRNETEAEESRQKISKFIKEAVKAYQVDAQKVYLMGFSQGAIMSLSIALTQPKSISGVVAMSGRLLHNIEQKAAPKSAFKQLPIFISHGTKDAVISIDEARATQQLLQQYPIKLSYNEYDMQHTINGECFRDIQVWLSEQLKP
jgi:phospholipase/carboxylesterase